MKTKTPIKVLTLALFVALISGFTLYKGGYLLPNEKKAAYISDPNGGSGLKLGEAEDFGLNTFQQLKLKGLLDPKYFDTLYTAPIFVPDNHHFLSSSKSMLISDYSYFKKTVTLHESFLSLLLDKQFGMSKQLKK